MSALYKRRKVLYGACAVFFAGCLGEDSGDKSICTYSTKRAFKTDAITALKYQGDSVKRDTDDGTVTVFQITTTLEIEPKSVGKITVYSENGSKITTSKVTEKQTDVTWDVGNRRPTGETYEMVAYQNGKRIDSSTIRAKCGN
ncbi:hypothetical protein [Haladaptatus sp. DYF46]|uniref:hypothetical protein n=1 Tax=Haladaptatus sp. DYF46 TaxID=2886041 RepID=UPI001E32BD9D|nr:hypothetical protein [Haladaptatus sp. DYF46]